MSGGNAWRPRRVDRFDPPLMDNKEPISAGDAALIVFCVAMLLLLAGGFMLAPKAKGDELPWAKSTVSAEGQTQTWTSDLYVYSPALDTNFAVSNCQASAHVVPGGAAVVRNLGGNMCTNASVHDFGTISAIPGLQEFVKLSFTRGASVTTVNVGPMKPIPAGGVKVGPVANGFGPDGTWLNFITQGSGYITVKVLNSAGDQIGLETFLVTAPATQHRLTTAVEAGSIEVTPSIAGFVCPGCTSFSGVLYGFATIGSPAGSNLNTLQLN